MLFTLQMKRNFKGKSQILRDFLPLKWKLQFTVRITYFLIEKKWFKILKRAKLYGKKRTSNFKNYPDF